MLDSAVSGIRADQRDQSGDTRPITIGDDAWMDRDVLVLKRVHTGNNEVVGARCVIADDVQARPVVVGATNPTMGAVNDQ